MNVILGVVIVAILHSAFLAGSATAAEFVHFASDECEWTLEGQIEKGDSSKLKLLNWAQDYEVKTLCLNSTGGNLVEGIAVAESIRVEEISTFVVGGDRCFSACAIAFMAGVVPPEGEGIPSISRTLDARGSLGFHRPAIILPKNTNNIFDEKTVTEAYRAAINAVGFLMDWLNKSSQSGIGNPVPFSLVEEMLKHEGSNMFLIDTVGKAGRWSIEVIGYKKPDSINKQMILDSCFNTLAWQGDRYPNKTSFVELNIEGAGLGVRSEKITEDKTLKELGYETEYEVITNDTEGGAGCEVFVNAKRTPVALEICAQDFWTNSKIGSCPTGNGELSTVPLISLALFPSELRLADLPGVEKKKKPSVLKVEVSSQNKSFQKLSNTDVVGIDIINFANLTDGKCIASCEKLNVCVAATYDRWNKFCTLKSSASELRTNSKSMSWLKDGLQAKPSNHQPQLHRRRDRSFPDKAYRKFKSRDYEKCAVECVQDSMCMGLNYRRDGQCELVKSLSEYQPSSKSDVAYKIEVP